MTNGSPPALSIQVSLAEIYDSLCPSCRDALLDLLSTKAGQGFLRDTLRSQFESPGPPLAASPTPDVGAPLAAPSDEP